jgi:hypothetical protein
MYQRLYAVYGIACEEELGAPTPSRLGGAGRGAGWLNLGPQALPGLPGLAGPPLRPTGLLGPFAGMVEDQGCALWWTYVTA